MSTKYVITGGGNWTSCWATASNQSVSDTIAPGGSDTGIMDQYSGSVSLSSANVGLGILNQTNYTGTLTISSGISLTLGAGTHTLAGTLAGTGTIAIAGICTIAGTPTSSSGVLFTSSKDVTMGTGSNCVWGNITFSAGKLIMNADVYTTNLGVLATIWGSYKLYVAGNLTGTSYTGPSGTPEIVMSGTGSLPANWTIGINFKIDTLGTITFGTGAITFSNPTNKTLTYTQGTLANLNNAILKVSGAGTLNTNGMTWNEVQLSATAGLTSDFQCTTLDCGIATTCSLLNANVTVDTLLIKNRASLTISSGYALTTNHLYISGVEGYDTILKASNPGSGATVNVNGSEDGSVIFMGKLTDIDFNKKMYNWFGTTTDGSNCIDVTMADLTNTNLLLK